MAEIFEKEQVLSGAAFYDGVIDGKEIKSGTLFILQELDVKNGNAKGQRTVEKRCDNADIVKALIHLEYPIKCKVTYEERVTKGAEKMVVISCIPIERATMRPDPHAPVHKGAA